MNFTLTLMETGAERELPMPPIVFGLVAFALLVVLLLIAMALGKGRPHS